LTQLTLVGAVEAPRESVYYGTDGCNIKIGLSGSVRRRGGELKITILLAFPGGLLDERRHHKMWEKYRIGDSEWFRPADELLLWITTQIEPRSRELAALQHVITQVNKTRRVRAA
jgi:hypothetical protein